MDLQFTEEQELFRHGIGRFLEKEYDAEARRQSLAAPAGVSPVVWRALAELGLFALPLPEACGGLGCGPVELGMAMEMLGRHLVVEPVLASIRAADVLAWAGSDAQRGAWLGRLIEGSARAVLAHEEDRSGIATRAVRTSSGGWRMDGRKTIVSGGPGADVLLVSALDEAEEMRLFLLSPDTPGVTLSPLRTLDGGRAADIDLQGVVLPGDALLTGDAAAALAEADRAGAVAACWEAVGAMTAMFEQTMAYVKQREQFGRPISAFQVVQHVAAELAVCCEEARAAAMLASLVTDAGEAMQTRAISAARVKIARCAAAVAKDAVQLHGGMGVSDELPIASYFRKLLDFEVRHGSIAVHLGRYTDAVLDGGYYGRSVVLPDVGNHAVERQPAREVAA